jgi:hypothetical protein
MDLSHSSPPQDLDHLFLENYYQLVFRTAYGVTERRECKTFRSRLRLAISALVWFIFRPRLTDIDDRDSGAIALRFLQRRGYR